MVDFNFEDTDELSFINEDFLTNWLTKVVTIENKQLGDVSLIFTSDTYLLKVNQDYLDHDYYTDIITFDYCEDDFVNGDLFISVDRVRENADLLNCPFETELNRVIVHGVLHLCGYKDKSDEDEKLMRVKEDQMLGLL
ncbi:MAG: rRNA maturation RNase YbeY [Crocinitomicaceae bacterium]|nr:rRNA maturation RNase YbeY [Crocinitomicaceae bacterium]